MTDTVNVPVELLRVVVEAYGTENVVGAALAALLPPDPARVVPTAPTTDEDAL